MNERLFVKRMYERDAMVDSVVSILLEEFDREAKDNFSKLRAIPSSSTIRSVAAYLAMTDDQRSRIKNAIGVRLACWIGSIKRSDYERSDEFDIYRRFLLSEDWPETTEFDVEPVDGKLVAAQISTTLSRLLSTKPVRIAEPGGYKFVGHYGAEKVQAFIYYKKRMSAFEYRINLSRSTDGISLRSIQNLSYEGMLGLGTGNWERISIKDLAGLGELFETAVVRTLSTARRIFQVIDMG